MPPLSVPMKPICDVTFVGQNKKLAVDWSQPTGEAGDMYVEAFAPAERNVVPDPMCYFHAASTNKYHVDQCNEIGGKFKDFCHAMLDGFSSALDVWRAQAKIQDLKVMAVSAIGAPGCLDGPSIESDMKTMSLPSASGNEKDWRDAVAEGTADCFAQWASKVTVPGLPWYPAFATFPSPTAPPIPNIPMPLIALPSAGLAKMSPSPLAKAMQDAFGLDDPDDQFGAASTSIATAISTAFLAWLPMQQVMLCLGKGPVPIYAPPIVPLGPVVAGDNVAAPGHLAA